MYTYLVPQNASWYLHKYDLSSLLCPCVGRQVLSGPHAEIESERNEDTQEKEHAEPDVSKKAPP